MTSSNLWLRIWQRKTHKLRRLLLLKRLLLKKSQLRNQNQRKKLRRPRRRARSPLIRRRTLKSQLRRKLRSQLKRRRKSQKISQWMPLPSRLTLQSSLMLLSTLSHQCQSSTTRLWPMMTISRSLLLSPAIQWPLWSRTKFPRSRTHPSRLLQINEIPRS